MRTVWKLAHRIDLGPTVAVVVAWLGACAVTVRYAPEMLPIGVALVVVVGVTIGAASGGLVGLWVVGSLVEYRQRGFRVNGEYIHVNKSPVGYTAYPMPVGANGNIFHINMELNF